MLATHDREKLINAIVFFCQKTQNCGITKLFKLLYFLDFEHYKQTGRSVTGLDYYAWKMGPVPVELYDEIPTAPEPDLAEKVAFKSIPTRFQKPFVKIEPKVGFDNSHFTVRELGLMERLAEEYKTVQSEDIIEATHIETLPWHRVFNDEGRKQGRIPYESALRKEEEDLLSVITTENLEMVKNYSE